MANLSELAPVKLTSGTNLKTINGESLLGSGNITVSGGGGGTPTLAENSYTLTPAPFATITAASSGNFTQVFQHTDSSWGMFQVASYYNPPQIQFKYGQASVTPDLATYFPVGSVWQNAGGMAQVVSIYNPASGQTNRYVGFQAVNGDTNSLNGFLNQQYWPNNQSPPWTLTFVGTTITTDVALTNGVVYTLANGASAFTGNGGTSYTLPGNIANLVGAKVYKRDNPIFYGGANLYNNATNSLILPTNGDFSGRISAASLFLGTTGGTASERAFRQQVSDKRRYMRFALMGKSTQNSVVQLTTDGTGTPTETNLMKFSAPYEYSHCYLRGFAFSFDENNPSSNYDYAGEGWMFEGMFAHGGQYYALSTVTKTRTSNWGPATLALGSNSTYLAPSITFSTPAYNLITCFASVEMIVFEY